MTAPNLLSPTTVTGKTAIAELTTSLVAIIDNPSASGKVFKINTIRAANITGSAVTISVCHHRGQHNYLLKDGALDGAKTIIVTDKNEYVYLEEGDQLMASSSSGSSVHLTINYEEIN
jgi:hypothetical protein